MRLSERDERTLIRALEIERRDPSAGIFPRGIQQHKQYTRLERAGMLVFLGLGRDADGIEQRDVLIYRLTDAGRTRAKKLDPAFVHEADAHQTMMGLAGGSVPTI